MKHVLVANSEGIWGEENRTRSRFTIEAVASSATEKQSGHLGPGGSEGYELFDRINVEDTAREAARIAVTMLAQSPALRGNPVVIDNGFGGVIFHEAADMVWRQRRWQEMRPFSQEDWDSRLHPLW